MTLRISLLAAALLGTATAHAADPYILFDTDRGPFIVELDYARAPLTSAHIAGAVDARHFDGLIFHRAIDNFVVQSGGVDPNGQLRVRPQTVASERNNGLTHTLGTIALALSSLPTGQPNYTSGTTQFFINTNPSGNSNLNNEYTVFGRVIYGMTVINAIDNAGVYPQSDVPVRPTLIKRAVTIEEFPVLPLHSGSWYDPANTGRGVSVEIANAAGGDGSPLAVVNWFDHADGKPLWLNGAAPFVIGAEEVTIPLVVAEGAQFGTAFDPDDVVRDDSAGTITLRFEDCNNGTFTYQTKYGNGTLDMTRLTTPDGVACPAN